MGILQNLIHGNLAIHQELINKFLKETLAENQVAKEITVSIKKGVINATALLDAGETPIVIKMVMSPGRYEFNRSSRYIELILHGPVVISIHGIEIKARLDVERSTVPPPAGTPDSLEKILDYLNIKEDKIILDLNKMPGFNQLLQNKLGFVFKNLEITSLELVEEMILIHPSLKFF